MHVVSAFNMKGPPRIPQVEFEWIGDWSKLSGALLTALTHGATSISIRHGPSHPCFTVGNSVEPLGSAIRAVNSERLGFPSVCVSDVCAVS